MNKSVNYQEMPAKDFEQLFNDAWDAWIAHHKKYKDAVFEGNMDKIKKMNEEQMEDIKIVRAICEEMLRRRQNENH